MNNINNSEDFSSEESPSEKYSKFSRPEWCKQYNKKYYEENKDYWKKPVECECGGTYAKSNHYHHNHTKRHMKYIKQQNKLDMLNSEKIEIIRSLLVA